VRQLLLAQLEHLDEGAAKLLSSLLGPTSSVAIALVIVRAWFKDKLRELELLKKRSQQDKLWKAMAQQRFDAHTSEIDRHARNLHELRSYVTGQQGMILALGRKLELELPEPSEMEWDVSQLPRAQLPAEIIESKTDEED
jgi:hypothetical protein